MALFRFLISFIVLCCFITGSKAVASYAAPAAGQAIDTIKEDKGKPYAIFKGRQSKITSFISRRQTPSVFSYKTSAGYWSKHVSILALVCGSVSFCTKAGISLVYARLLSFFVFPQRSSLYPTHVYW